MNPALPVYSRAWSSGRPSVPSPPRAMLLPAHGSVGPQRYVTYPDWLRMRGWNLSGLGQLGQEGPGVGQRLTIAAPTIAMATLATASHFGAAWATAAIPVVGPIIAGVTVALMLIFGRKGPKQRRATTEIVNKVEPLLKKNLDGYLSGPRTRAAQEQALANFDAGWQYVQEYCGIPEMGNPGKACISDRQSGACIWRDEANECWNWFKGYRDPIANDPNVRTDPVVDTLTGKLVDPLTGQTFSAGGLGGGNFYLLAGLGLLAAVLLMGDGK